MTITYYGHSCFGLQYNEKYILFDPFISPNPLAKEIDIKDIHAHLILISHGHHSHMADAVEIAKQTGAKVVSNSEIVKRLKEEGITNTHAMNVGGNMKLDIGRLKFVKAEHSSSDEEGNYMGSPGGFILELGDTCLYYAGDTGLTTDMQLIAREFDVDHAFLPIGDNYTMGVDDAIVASEFIKCKSIIGMHFNTFPYIAINTEEAEAKFESAGANLTIMRIGETIAL